jgi:hypothetical protein
MRREADRWSCQERKYAFTLSHKGYALSVIATWGPKSTAKLLTGQRSQSMVLGAMCQDFFC